MSSAAKIEILKQIVRFGQKHWQIGNLKLFEQQASVFSLLIQQLTEAMLRALAKIWRNFSCSK